MIKVSHDGNLRSSYLNSNAKATLLFAHGAGAGNKHAFMQDYAMAITESGFNVITFNFPYMQMSYELEKRRPPNRAPQLIEYYRQELEQVIQSNKRQLPLFLVGKSMGGRVASLLASEHSRDVAGVIVLGYPFIPPGKPEKLDGRIEHFPRIEVPVLILQGERDTFGGLNLLSNLSLPKNIFVEFIPDGDHSFKPRKSSGFSESTNLDLAVGKINDFTDRIIGNDH